MITILCTFKNPIHIKANVLVSYMLLLLVLEKIQEDNGNIDLQETWGDAQRGLCIALLG